MRREAALEGRGMEERENERAGKKSILVRV